MNTINRACIYCLLYNINTITILSDCSTPTMKFVNQEEKFVKGFRGKFTAVDISMNLSGDTKVGFKWDNNSNAYELVTDLDLWKFDLPVERFISKVTQMYAYETIISKTKEDGYQIVEQKNQNDGSIELVLTKWEN